MLDLDPKADAEEWNYLNVTTKTDKNEKYQGKKSITTKIFHNPTQEMKILKGLHEAAIENIKNSKSKPDDFGLLKQTVERHQKQGDNHLKLQKNSGTELSPVGLLAVKMRYVHKRCYENLLFIINSVNNPNLFFFKKQTFLQQTNLNLILLYILGLRSFFCC